MEFQYRTNYNYLTDKQIVARILAEPHDEEAAAYLLHNRYDPLLHKVYNHITQDSTWFDDCVDELYIHLKGKDCTWHALASFQWRSTLGGWLSGVARNKFNEILPKLIGNRDVNVSIDGEELGKPKIQIPDGNIESFERRMRKVMLLEAISKLKDGDQRFVILKRLEGYNSSEIAILLKKKWQKHGIVKYNNKKELVVPDAAYVDVRTQRAKENLRKLMDE